MIENKKVIGLNDMEHIEFEKKQLLTKEAYENKIEELFSLTPGENFIQVNYYYDTTAFDMCKNNQTVRVRLKDSELNLEYKLHRAYINGTRICEEKTKPLNMLPKSIMVQQFELFFIGSLITQRTNFLINDYLISLDKNYYLGIVDYEIEIEIELDSTTTFLPSVLKILDEDSFTPGKYTRFISALNKTKQSITITL
jgi:uncharacterized protein YjbK